VTPDLERTGKRLGLATLAVALVVSMALSGYAPGEGPIEEAAAVHNCENTDALVYGFSFGYVNEDKCTNNHVNDAVEEVREAESQQTKVDIYSAASGQKANIENFDAVYGNYLNDSESVAWMKAEKAIAEAYENGSTKSEAKVAAREAIAEYYTIKQLNLIENWNTTVTAWEYFHERSIQEGYQQAGFGDESWEAHGRTAHFVDWTETDNSINNPCFPSQITTRQSDLANGSSQTTIAIDFARVGYPSQYTYIYPAFENSSDSEYGSYQPAYDRFECNGPTIKHLMIDAPDSNYNDLMLVRMADFVERYRTIEAKNTEMQDEANVFVDSTYQDFQDGNINSSDVISRNTQMFEYGSKAQGSSNYYDSIGATAAMGLETPDLNGTGQMTVTDGGGTTHEGMLFGDPPNGSWTVGTTYDPSNISGPVIMATTDGEEHELTRPFTVESATDKDGNEQSVVETQRYNYQTSNTSDLNEKYNRLLGLSDELQQRSESVDSNNGGGGGGGSSGGGTIPDWLTATYFGIPLWAIAAVLLVALVLIGGDN
jgi:hypothetical protein